MLVTMAEIKEGLLDFVDFFLGFRLPQKKVQKEIDSIHIQLQNPKSMGIFRPGWKIASIQWLFLVPIKGGRWHIIPQLAVYTTYILPSGG